MVIIRKPVLIVLLLVHCCAFSQDSKLQPRKLLESIREAPSPDHGDFSALFELFYTPGLDPVALAAGWRAQLQPIEPKSAMEYNMAFITMFAHDRKNRNADIALVKPYLDTMLQLGLSSNDLRRQAHATWAYGAHLRPYQRLDESATYCLLSIQLYEKLPFFERMYAKYGALAEILFQTGDYRPCIEYGLKALAGEDWIIKHYDYRSLVRYLNTIGQACFRLGQSDSAAHYYQRSKQVAAEKGDTQWVAINTSFEGQLFLEKGQPDKAFSLFEEGYLANRGKDAPMASFSLAGMGKSRFAMGQTAPAQRLLWQALHVAGQSSSIQRWQVANYRKEIFTTLALIHLKQNRQDSFYYYTHAAQKLQDSMMKVVSLSNLRMAETRSQVEQYRMQAAMVEERQHRERLVRNFIIAGILLVAAVVILLLRRHNRILQLEKQMALAKKQAADAEIAAAKEKLAFFVQTLHEKSALIDKLQENGKNDTPLPSGLLQDLTRQAILTEEDWVSFRNNFEKIYPGFFVRIRQAAPDITMAEQRMAALSMLQINSKEMSAILGISIDSVRKTRQRLRQRLQLSSDDDLMARLAAMVSPSA